MYNSLIQMLVETKEPDLISVTADLTDWKRIERSINKIRLRQNEAKTEEQFQVVGLLSRETIIYFSLSGFLKRKNTPFLTAKKLERLMQKECYKHTQPYNWQVLQMEL